MAIPLISSIDRTSLTFRNNAKRNRGLAEELRARMREAAEGGPKEARERHAARGKLLPRERVERLIDPGSPLLEIAPLAAHGVYEGEAPGAGIITGIGSVAGREVMI